MKVYIAGPMTGHEAYNFPAFDHAASVWRGDGHDVTTPADITRGQWREKYGREFDPRADRSDWGGSDIRAQFSRDIAAVLTRDALALLPGWERSRGAAIEIAVAAALGLRFFDAVTCEPLAPEVMCRASRPAAPETALQEAQRLVHGDRGAAYGHPIDDYTRTGRMWGAILGLPDIDPRLCCLMMAAVKVSREVNAPKRDNRVDLAGYAECAQMVAERQGLK